MYKHVMVTLVLILVSPLYAVAQQGGGKGGGERSCGTLENASDHLTRHEEVFQSAEYAWFRDAHRISSLSSSDTRALVSDTSVCGELLAHAEDQMNYSPFPEPGYAVYRYGDYYMLEVQFGGYSVSGDGTNISAASGRMNDLLFYNAKNMKYIAALTL